MAAAAMRSRWTTPGTVAGTLMLPLLLRSVQSEPSSDSLTYDALTTDAAQQAAAANSAKVSWAADMTEPDEGDAA